MANHLSTIAKIIKNDSSMAPPKLGLEASWGSKESRKRLPGNPLKRGFFSSCTPMHIVTRGNILAYCLERRHPVPFNAKFCSKGGHTESVRTKDPALHRQAYAFGHSGYEVWFCPSTHLHVQRHGKQGQQSHQS